MLLPDLQSSSSIPTFFHHIRRVCTPRAAYITCFELHSIRHTTRITSHFPKQMIHYVVRITSRASRHTSHVIYVIRTTSHASRKTAHVLRHTPNCTLFTIFHASRITHHSAYHTVYVACHPSHAKHHKSHNTRTMPHKSRHTADVADHPPHASRIKSHGMRHTPQVEDAFDRCSDSSQRFTIKFAVVTRHKHHITPRTSHAYTSRLMHHSELHTSPITRHNADGTSRTLYLSFALIDKRFALATRCSL